MTEMPVEEAPGRWRVTRHADVVAALADDRLEVPSPAAAEGPMAEFRASVSRFSNGEPHAVRRAEVLRVLEPVSAAALRDRTRERLSAVLAESGGDRIDLMP